MKTSYIIENHNGEIIGYSIQLCEAKRILERNSPKLGKITCLKGPYFHEGFHHYYLIFDGKKYNKLKE